METSIAWNRLWMTTPQRSSSPIAAATEITHVLFLPAVPGDLEAMLSDGQTPKVSKYLMHELRYWTHY